MPSLRKPKFKDSDVVRCWETVGGQDEDGSTIVAIRGETFRGNHPLVRRNPGCFVPADTPDNEMPAASASIAAIPVPDWQRDPTPPIPDDQAAIATETFHVVIAGRDRSIAAGDRLDRSDAVVVQHPELFETPGKPLAVA